MYTYFYSKLTPVHGVFTDSHLYLRLRSMDDNFYCFTAETQLATLNCGIEGLPLNIVEDTSKGLEPK